MECFGVLPEFNTLLIVSQNEDVSTENEWTGIINTIKTYSRQGFRLQREMIQKLFASTAAEIKGTQQDVKDTKLDI